MPLPQNQRPINTQNQGDRVINIVARARNLALVGIIVLVAALALVDWRAMETSYKARGWARHAREVLDTIDQLGLAVRDAETGQRGYLLTGEQSYLVPYARAYDKVPLLQGELRRQTADDPVQQDSLNALAVSLQHKMEELSQTIELRRDSGPDAALAVVRADSGRLLMEQIEARLADMTAQERQLLEQRLTAVARWDEITRVGAVVVVALALLLLAAAARLIAAARDQLTAAAARQQRLAMHLQTSLDSISQGIGVFDAGFTLRHWNVCLPVLLGLPDGTLRTGDHYATLASFVSERNGGAALLESEEEIRHGPAGNSPGEPVVYERTFPSRERTFELRRTATPDGGFVLTVSDITERIRSEASLRESARLQAVGQLTGGIAHDFNNLLTIILGNLDFAIGKLEPGNLLRVRLERAMWGARRGAALTHQLLAFARRQPLAPQPINLSTMLVELATLLRHTLGETIEVRAVDCAGLWLAMADASQVETAVLNLALNARDAMPQGGQLTLEVSNKVIDDAYARAHTEVAPGDYVMIAVSDTGTGMPAEVVARVFEPFFTTKAPGKGTGLGLSMVFGFAKQSGGHVKVYSEPGEGTTVRLYLPRAPRLTQSAEPRNAAPAHLPRGSATILVVEDEPGVREVARDILGDLGYRVLEASDGSEAVRVFAENSAAVDLALLDVVLPGSMRGNELARRLTEMRPSLRVLYMSGYTQNAIVHHGRLDDGVILVSKPFQREQLARKVAEALGTAMPDQGSAQVVDLRTRRPDGGAASG
jgi:signal transduction histidine kinase